MDIGVVEIVLDQPDTAGAIEAAAAIGFDGVELRLTSMDPEKNAIGTDRKRDRLRRLVTETGIAVPGCIVSFLAERAGIVADDPRVRQRAANALVQTVEDAEAADIGVLLLPFFGAAELSTKMQEDRMIEHVRKAAVTAEETGVTLAIENTLPADDNVRLIDRIGSPAVSLYYDMANTTSFGYDPAAEIEQLGERIVGVHVKDRDPKGRDVALGDGMVDFEAVSEALDRIGYDGWLVVESPPEGDVIEGGRRNLAFSKALFG